MVILNCYAGQDVCLVISLIKGYVSLFSFPLFFSFLKILYFLVNNKDIVKKMFGVIK